MSNALHAEQARNRNALRIPILHCGHTSRSFRAVLKRQEVKERSGERTTRILPSGLLKIYRKWQVRSLTWYTRVLRRPNSSNYAQTTNYFFKPSKVSPVDFREPNEMYTLWNLKTWNRSLTCSLLVVLLSEPTQIYRFLRTRNAVAVSQFCSL